MTKLMTKIKLRFDNSIYEYFNIDLNHGSVPIYIEDYEAEFYIEYSTSIRIFTYSPNDEQIDVIGILLGNYKPEYYFEIKNGEVDY